MDLRTSEQIQAQVRSTVGTRKNPFEASLAVSVATSKWGTRRKVDSKSLDMTAQDEEGESEIVSPEAVRVSKALIKSKAYDAIGHRDAAGRSLLNGLALPSNLRRSTYLVPIALLDDCETILGDWQREREALIAAFLQEYASAIANARQGLGPLFDASQYPTRETVRAAFGLEWHYETFDLPGKLEALRPELFAQERGKLAAKMQAASVQIQDALRIGLADMVGALAEKLKGDRSISLHVLENFEHLEDIERDDQFRLQVGEIGVAQDQSIGQAAGQSQYDAHG